MFGRADGHNVRLIDRPTGPNNHARSGSKAILRQVGLNHEKPPANQPGSLRSRCSGDGTAVHAQGTGRFNRVTTASVQRSAASSHRGLTNRARSGGNRGVATNAAGGDALHPFSSQTWPRRRVRLPGACPDTRPSKSRSPWRRPLLNRITHLLPRNAVCAGHTSSRSP